MNKNRTINWSTVPGKPGAVLRRSVGRGVRAIASQDTRSNPDLQRSIGRPAERQFRRFSGTVLSLVGLLLLGFIIQVAGISQLRHDRDQSMLYSQFRYSLANATAPVAQVDEKGRVYALGTPVALIAIPKIGLSEIAVEGTTSRALLSGPGHRRDTPLPGQGGSSVIMGRQSAYGGPFGGIASLTAGDTITTTTGQGVSTYTVTAKRYAGDNQPAALAPGKGRLTLVSATGAPYFADGVVRVDATLTSKTFATPNPALLVGSLTDSEGTLASDSSGLLPLLLLVELAAAAIMLLSIAIRRWGRWQTWIVATPVAIVLGTAIAEQVIVLLPNLY